MTPQTIHIDNVEYVRKDSVQAPSGPVKIVVLDRGFVYIGRVEESADKVTIKNAHNIRAWGTTKGLGELAIEGPKSGTKLDRVGTVYAPSRALISLIDVDASKWKEI